MNTKRYRLIFSKRLKALIAVAECCLSAGKSVGESSFTQSVAKSSFTRFVGLLSFGYLSVYSAYGAPAVDALPQGGVVAQGAASIQQTNNVMNITQSTDKAVVNWQSFDIGSAARVNVLQPNATSVLLNRVLGNNPSQIFGSLTANGEVILINPNGILFGRDGSVNASAFTASTLDIKDSDFMSGNYRYFRTGGSGEIINQGSINTRGYVALLGAKVTNDGLISTQGGNVMLGAGEAVALPVTNSGRIRMELTPASINAAIENTQQGVIVTQGGQVLVQASAINDAVASVVQAGAIDTQGEQGGNVTVLADSNIRVSGSINASSVDSNQLGGRIIVGGDEVTGALAKSVDVSGASFTTSKGFVETSGGVLKADGVKVQAADWLLDPYNITISNATSTNGSFNGSTPNTWTPSATGSVVQAADIENALNNGTSIKISTGLTGSAGSEDGTITIQNNITKSSGGAATLEFEANHRIILNNGISITDSSTNNLSVSMTALGNGVPSVGSVYMKSGSQIDVGGAINIQATTHGGSLSGAAFYMDVGPSTTNTYAATGGSTVTPYTTLRASVIDIQTTATGADTYGVYARFGGIIEATGGNINISSTHTGAGTTGTGIVMGTNWGSGGAGDTPQKFTLNANSGAITLQTHTTGTSAVGNINLVVQASARDDIIIDSQTQSSTSKAIDIQTVFHQANFNSTSGDIKFLSNQGAINFSGLNTNSLTARNITISNTGGTFNGTTFTAGLGSYTASAVAGISLTSSNSSLVATGKLTIAGASSGTGTGVALSGGAMSAASILISGRNVGAGTDTSYAIQSATTLSASGDIEISAQSTNDTALHQTANITASGTLSLTGITAATRNATAGIRLAGVSKGSNIVLNATATNSSNSVLGYYGATGSLEATTGSLALTGSSASSGNGFYMYGGSLTARTGINISGTSTTGQAVTFDKNSAATPNTLVNISNLSSGGISITANAQNSTQTGLSLNGTSISNSSGAISFIATSGHLVASSADNTITQSGTGDITLSTANNANLTAPKIINNGSGNVILTAGSNLSAGTTTGGNVLTLLGNTITQNSAGKTYIYTGTASGTGDLGYLNASFETLYYEGSTYTHNAAFNSAYNSTILGGANYQVLFRSNTAPSFTLTLPSTQLSKSYGQTDPTLAQVRTAIQTSYSLASGANILTTDVVGAGGSNTFGLASAEAILALTGSRVSGETSAGSPYAYSLSAPSLNAYVAGASPVLVISGAAPNTSPTRESQKPFVKPVDQSLKPTQPYGSKVKSNIIVASNDVVTVASAEVPKKIDVVSMTQCVSTALTGVSLCFLPSE